MDQAAIERFFTDYAAASLDDDPAKVAAQYAPSFIAAAPEGSATFANDERFIDWLRGLREFNRKAGMTSLAPASVSVTSLSAKHSFVTVTWDARFEKTGAMPITFDITYLLEARDGAPQILAYVAHTSQEEEMRRLGLL